MRILDENGQLFGVVNVVDAVVVLVVVVAGVAVASLVFGGGGGQTEPTLTYSTVEYTLAPGTNLDSGGLVRPNDTLGPAGDEDAFSVTDVHYSFTSAGSVYVEARVASRGAPSIGGGEVLAGDQHRMVVGATRQRVGFTAVNGTGANLTTARLPVTLAFNDSKWSTHAIEPGSTAVIGGRTTATITSVSTDLDREGASDVFVGLELWVHRDGGGPRYGGRRIRVNTPATVVTDDAVVSGRIYRIGATDGVNGTQG